ncbi:unnamed protein product [Protopolystoma xenopodis]|uniref:X-box-binding protein 1 n=1 Tax=Protopolystoma xenopodis TaxID=117903 RepID=A0A448X1C6_9PLAT|nr:unnamed protein product [Protopolystoma xenopodis]
MSPPQTARSLPSKMIYLNKGPTIFQHSSRPHKVLENAFIRSAGIRRRAKLDYLTEDEKLARRKILNREAAQKARDRKRELMDDLEQSISEMNTENQLLRCANRALREKFKAQESKIDELQRKFSHIISVMKQLGQQSKINQIEPLESAALLPQPKGVVLWLILLLLSLHLDKNHLLSMNELSLISALTPRPLADSESSSEIVLNQVNCDRPTLYERIYDSLLTEDATTSPLSFSRDSDDNLDDILDCLYKDGLSPDCLISDSCSPDYSATSL